jgi:RHS repeat-associated protein
MQIACAYDVASRSVYKFTGKERDSESGLDNFGARYFTSSLGRFMTPDWAARPTTVPYAVFGDPQTLNLYTYIENEPINRADADGHQAGEIVQQIVESPAGQAVENWGSQVLAGAGVLLTTAATALSNGQLGNAYPSYYHGELQNPDGSSVFLSKKNVPNPNGSKGAPDHQQTADEEAAKMGPNGQREVRVDTPGGEKGTRVIDAAKVENGKVTEATQVIRPNKNGTPPAREVRAANDIQKATGVKPKMVPVRPCTNNNNDGCSK